MAKAHASVHMGDKGYTTTAKMRAFQWIFDEPASGGGNDHGPTPSEALASALGACTAITLRMYASRKGWDLQGVDVEVEVDWRANPQAVSRRLTIHGNLSDAQRTRLQQIADACPVHKLLANPTVIETTLAEGAPA